MNLKQVQREETHERILDAARRLFRTDGYQKTGVAQVMESIGLTVGGFYNHFESKEALFEEVVDKSMSRIVEGEAVEEGDPAAFFSCVVNRYLSTEHRDNPGIGCILPALTPEVARADDEVQQAYTRFVTRIADRVAGNIAATGVGEADKRALALMALLVGGLMMSRGVDDEALSEQILAASREAAESIVKAP